MDRFIVGKDKPVIIQIFKFKIQYGQIYSATAAKWGTAIVGLKSNMDRFIDL